MVLCMLLILIHMYYFSFKPCTQFCTTSRFKVLADCQCILHSFIIISDILHNISKGKGNILEILILLFDFRILIWTLLTRSLIHKFVHYTTLIFIFDFCRQISHNFKNQEQTRFDLLLQHLYYVGFFPKR